MKKLFLLLQVLLIIRVNAYCDNYNVPLWKNLQDAITTGSIQYMDYKNEKFSKYAVFVIKVISCSKRNGIFSISYILNDGQFDNINASNFLEINNKLILIRTDSLKTIFSEKSGIPVINNYAKNKAYDILAGPNNTLTAQPPSIMIIKYKGKKVTSKYFGATFFVDEKYLYYNNKR